MPPTVAIGLNMNEWSPGAGKPQPLKMWQSASKASIWSALTAGSFCMAHGYGYLNVSARHGATERHWTGRTNVGAAKGG
ncbi:hypothetical protein GCM10027091_36360 [Streptomyces daliensis]